MISFPQPDVEQFLQTFHIQTFAVSEDEKQLIFSTNLTGKFDLWAVDLPHLFPYPLTFRGENCASIHFDPHRRYVVASFDRDGDENWQLFALPCQGGVLKPIISIPGKKYFVSYISSDGERIYYTSNHENANYLNIYRYHLKEGREELLWQGRETAIELVSVRSDEAAFAFAKDFANTHRLGYLHLRDELVCITDERAPAHVVRDVVFYSEEKVLLTTNYRADFLYLAQFDLKERKLTPLITLEQTDIVEIKHLPGQSQVLLKTEKGVQDALYQFDVVTRELKPLSLPVDVVQQIVLLPSGNLYLLGSKSTRPTNLYRKRAGEMHWEAITHYQVPGVAEERLVEPEVVRYPSYDGLEIEALFFRAHADVSNDHVIIWPHGGPQWAERKYYRVLFQFLLSRGYSIFAPNFRGSTGYGLSFCQKVERDWGHGPRLDLITGIDWLIEQGWVKRGNLFVLGRSYGGYMTLLLAGRHADYFKAAVDIFGPSNLFSFIESVPDDWKPFMKQWVGDPIKDREKLQEDSPITYVQQMVKPMLIVQGANDPRVIQQESDQVVAQLRALGREVEYMVMSDEGHEFTKKENEIKVYSRIADFFDQFLS